MGDEVTATTRARVTDRLKGNKTAVDGTKCLEFARDVLTKLDRWMDVSIALALVTGRRMAEIHSAKSNFVKVDDYLVHFSGQLKTSRRENQDTVKPYNIPVLLPADMVIAGREYLKQCDKLYTDKKNEVGLTIEIPEVVNACVSMSLSRAIKIRLNDFKKGEKAITYKDCRAIYADMSWQLFGNQDLEEKAPLLSVILGHTPGDINTANNYCIYAVDVEWEGFGVYADAQQRKNDYGGSMIKYFQTENDS